MAVNIVTGEVIERNPAVFLRQVTGEDGTLITQADIATITYDVYIVPMTRARYIELYGKLNIKDSALLPLDTTDVPVPVAIQQALTVSNVVFDTAQLDNRWTQDAVGYNFAADLGGHNFPEIDLADYPDPEWQEVWFTFTPVVGKAFQVGYVVKKFFSLANRLTGVGSGT